jgi:hypothetical protein
MKFLNWLDSNEANQKEGSQRKKEVKTKTIITGEE